MNITVKYLEDLQRITKLYLRGILKRNEAYDGYADVLHQAAQDKAVDKWMYRELVRYTYEKI